MVLAGRPSVVQVIFVYKESPPVEVLTSWGFETSNPVIKDLITARNKVIEGGYVRIYFQLYCLEFLACSGLAANSLSLVRPNIGVTFGSKKET